ncbi:MAG TPA: hypothetical protein VMT85_03895 [Thermoanaerobaculia bacterium]|nr:hypothetical protein [Thermoanaerobaculia bacterium]
MPLLSGSVSCTRFDVHSPTADLDLESQAFRAIAPGSEVRESIGFVPFEPGAEYRVGAARWAFRVRIDRLRADPTAVRERLRELVAAEQEATGAPFVAPKRRTELRHLAEEELLADARPQSQIVEGVIDRRLSYVATTSNNVLGKIVLLLRKVGVLVDFKTPWNDLGQEDLESEILALSDATQSIHGSRFLQALGEDDEIVFEPSDGYVKLQTREARVVLSGGVLHELHGYFDQEIELLAAKLQSAVGTFRLDGLTFRISSLGVERARPAHWTERLDERIERIATVWELLDRKYAEHARGRSSRARRPARREELGAGGATHGQVVPFDPAR